MSNLTNKIQQYIKSLLENSEFGYVEIQRSKLAKQFVCVPSQINYVLGTRFSIKQGYVVESQQGGGGYLRIIKLPLVKDEFLELINNSIGSSITEKGAHGLLKRLYEEEILTYRETLLMKAIIKRDTLGASNRDQIRSNILKTMLKTLLREDFRRN